jgi:Hydrophobic surface binding protein A
MFLSHYVLLIVLPYLASADFNTFQDVYSSIADALLSLDQAVFNISSELSTVSSLTPATKFVIETIHNGTQVISAAPGLEMTEMSLFLVTSKTLVDATNLTVSDLESKKSLIASANATGIVSGLVNQLQMAMKEFIPVVMSKVPVDIRSLAQDQAAVVMESLDIGVRLFQGAR